MGIFAIEIFLLDFPFKRPAEAVSWWGGGLFSWKFEYLWEYEALCKIALGCESEAIVSV
jgi:hypothetical protein